MYVSKEAVTAIGTIVIAVSIGYVMQSGDTAKMRYGAPQPATAPAESELTNDEPAPAIPQRIAPVRESSMLRVDAIQLTSAEPATNELKIGSRAEPMRPDAPADPEPAVAADSKTCDITGVAEPQLAAIVALSVSSPCRPDTAFTVHHQGMMFSMETDAAGEAKIYVPALAQDAVFIVSFDQGEGLIATATVEDVDRYARTVLQWNGDTGFQLHAREFGADYAEDGHIWYGIEQSLTGLVGGQNGFVQRLGQPSGHDGYVAEVYSFPVGYAKHSGLIQITVEAEISDMNCGRNIAAQSLDFENGELRTRDLTLSIPPCDAVGDYMVLNNLVADLKVAQR